MIHLFINALAASAGGGLTYVHNVVPLFSGRADARATVLVNAALGKELGQPGNVDLQIVDAPDGAGRRYWFEQRRLPELIRQSRADVLLSAGNFALSKSPVPQILLSRNALYTSADFRNDLRQRHAYVLLLDNALKAEFAKRSILRADVTVAPSEAFAAELRQWTGAEVRTIHHGFDREAFLQDESPLPEPVQRQLDETRDAVRLLFVSHYNYYRNFETLLRALPLLRESFAPRPVRLLLTCKLQSGLNPGSYRAGPAAALVRRLKISDNIVELGFVPYRQLHQVYARSDVYVTPAYAESFAHPLVEAMSTGRPVVASDIPVHREICGKAATYFDRFSAEALAGAVVHVATSAAMADKLAAAGLRRSGDFSWKTHLEAILQLARQLGTPDRASVVS